jgi:hypothetical protein
MTGRKLPPLLVGGCYEGPPLCDIDFTPPDLEREIRGEATAVLRLSLTNDVRLSFPLRAFQLQMLMCSLMRMFPQQALANLRIPEEEGEDQGSGSGPGRSRGMRKG